MANPDFDDVLTSTIVSRSGKLADNMTDNNALLRRLKSKGKIRPVSGGSKIIEELEYGEGDLTWYSGYDTIDYTPKQLFTAAEYSLKLCAVPVAISCPSCRPTENVVSVLGLYQISWFPPSRIL